MAKKTDAEKPEIPDVEVEDEVYFKHGDGPCSGKVVCHGKTGCTVHCQHGRHRVRWEHLLGHKVRVQPNYRVADEGEDGLIVEDGRGRRRFIHDPDTKSPPIQKSLGPMLFFVGQNLDVLKAVPIKNRSGLSLQDVTDRSGHQTKRWKRTTKPEKKERPHKVADDVGAKSGYGTHNLGDGDEVSFKMGEVEGKGTIVGRPGSAGAHVKDRTGRVHKILWSDVTGHKPASEGKPKPLSSGVPDKEENPEKKPAHEKIDPEKFSSADFAKAHDDDKTSVASILSHFPPDTSDKIAAVQKRLESIEQTIDKYKSGNRYRREREALHREIYKEVLSPTRIASATPNDGQAPTMVMLGGRGGSGKSWFKGKVYDPDKAVVVDADEIKSRLPEYEGWNAAQIHEESSDILETIVDAARAMGLNVVLDATMKSTKGAMDRVGSFKSAGYRIEAHYMHLPRQEAAKRAVSRFLGKTQRYVPVEVVLANTTNEQTFDEVRKHADKWSFRDNNVAEGEDPVLISEGGPLKSEDGGSRSTT